MKMLIDKEWLKRMIELEEGMSVEVGSIPNKDSERAKAINEAILTGTSFVMVTCESGENDAIEIKYTHINKESVIINPTLPK